MKDDYRIGIFALGLFVGSALMATPAISGSLDREAYFGGTLQPMGPWFNRHVQNFNSLNNSEALRYPNSAAYETNEVVYRY
jgi:hypothetical protein